MKPESNYYPTKFFTENSLAKEIRLFQIIMNKLVYLGLSLLNLSITVIYGSWYDYVKPKYCEKTNIIWIQTVPLSK